MKHVMVIWFIRSANKDLPTLIPDQPGVIYVTQNPVTSGTDYTNLIIMQILC